MSRLIALMMLFLSAPGYAGPYDNLLRTDPPQSGRIIAEDGTVTNLADTLRALPVNIVRGQVVGAEPFSAYGERTTIGVETDVPVWPDGAIALAPYGAGVTIQSTSADDSAAGTGVQALHVHYVRQDLTAVDGTIITMNGVTPVPLNDPRFLFMQCMHIVDGRVGSGLKAAGTITAKNSAGTATYSEIEVGKLRCSSSFRIVPRAKVLIIDGAVGSSVSVTADTTTLLRIVANRIATHQYNNPLMLIPQASVGVQNNAISASFGGGLGPFPQGTVIGCNHTSNKAATVSCSWFGRLEPAP